MLWLACRSTVTVNIRSAGAPAVTLISLQLMEQLVELLPPAFFCALTSRQNCMLEIADLMQLAPKASQLGERRHRSTAKTTLEEISLHEFEAICASL
ncbi:hypothetical protein EYF80_040268 [Liparis tanakae]|uniref:Uncharacterized protein n=1 Tax=Liparis tanakae TaxID=230148 RepID=A0A4Z2G7J3_9TELE|nr:hypothetical protein EYF80_040268 [Liparis tanakae]